MKSDEEQLIFCQKLTMRLIVFYTMFSVIVRNFSAEEINHEIDAVIGQDVELPCNVTSESEGDKLNILAWYGNDSSTAFLSRDLRAEDDNGDINSDDPKGRFKLVGYEEEGTSNLLIHAVRPSDAGRYRCMVDFSASPSQNTYIQLNVIEPPQRLWVIHENGTRVTTATPGSNASENIGPYYVGDWVHLFCVAFGGRPLANLTWWAEQQPLKDTWTPLSEQRVRSDLRLGPLRREDHGQVLSCTAANNDVTPPLAIDVVIDMYLPPELVSVRDMNASAAGEGGGGGRARAGEALHLQCRVLGARPTPLVQWRMDDQPLDLHQNLIREPSQRLVISEVQLVLKESYDEGLVTCCAPSHQRGDEAMLCAQAMPLSVIYRPVLEIGVANLSVENNTLTVVQGQDVTINCSYKANPSVYQIMWFHEDDIISQDEEDESPMQPVLQLSNVTAAAAGEYVCAASNGEGSTYSEPLNIDVTYPPYCEDPTVVEYGLSEGESLNITCKLTANPEPQIYRWIIVNGRYDSNTFRPSQPHTLRETTDGVLQFQRPNGSTFNTIICLGENGVSVAEVAGQGVPRAECTYVVTDETPPRPPAACEAVGEAPGEIAVRCQPGYDGGLPQKFKFSMQALDTEEELVSIVSVEPEFIIQKPKGDDFKFVIIATNDKGDSTPVEIEKENIIYDNKEKNIAKSAVTNITTLALALCGGVLLVALAACGLVLCAHEKGSRLELPHGTTSDPPLCAYNTEESNCETFHDSDDGSDCNVRRTESFRRAISRYPSSKNYDVRRTSSFHSARYMNDMAEQEAAKCSDMLRHTAGCRVHSLQNISRKREMEAACDHLIMHLPPDPGYQVAKPMNTFYTMPRKSKNKSMRNIRDDTSEITQTSDGFSLPPPPDEFGTYRAATRIKDVPAKSIPTYTTIKKSQKEPSRNYNDNVVISPMNTVGLPTISGAQTVYSYPDDDHHQVSTNPFDDSS